jgi:ABC-type nitrate/sulfonate/bicarbonate transport system, ATPase component
MEMVKLEIKSAWYEKEKPVLTGFSLYAGEGETVTVTGLSGAGKSTLLAIIAGLHTNYEGYVKTGGSIALIPQKKCLLPFHTVIDNITLLAKARGLKPDVKKAMALLKELGLPGYENKYPGQLSGGQYSRVALGQSLFSEPDVLLMDEPFSALDVETKEGVIALFRRMQEEQCITTIFVTHDINEADAIGGRIVRLNHE